MIVVDHHLGSIHCLIEKQKMLEPVNEEHSIRDEDGGNDYWLSKQIFIQPTSYHGELFSTNILVKVALINQTQCVIR